MPQAIIAIATAASAAAANTAAALGASSAVIETVSSLTYSAAALGVTTGALYGIGVAMAPKIPTYDLTTPLKQPMMPRQSATGAVRVSGGYALFTTGSSHPNISYDVMAQLDGESDGLVQHYLNDDLMAPVGAYWWAPGAPGKYGGGGSNPPNLVKIDNRLGLATETAYPISADVPAWTTDHRGDGVTSALLTLIQAKREDQPGDFPNGLATLSSVYRAQKLFDPRDGTQTQGTRSSYKWTANGPLGLLGYMTDANGGMGLDYARFFAPAISFWQAAADEADGLVSTSGMHATLLDAAAAGDAKIFVADQTGLAAGVVIQLATETVTVSALATAGEVDLTGALQFAHPQGELAYWNATGQQARFNCNALYGHDTQPGDVIKSYLSTFDGWLAPRGDGAIVLRANTLYAPSVVLADRHIVGYQLQTYLPDEQATNQFVVSYTDPASAFNKAEAGYVQDDIDIAARGQPRSQELYLQWVPSAPQAMAVARAVLARATQPVRGTITCNLAGLAVMGERYVRLQISEQPALADAIVEVIGKVSIDLQAMQVSFPFVRAGNRMASSTSAICFVVDVSGSVVTGLLAEMKTALANALKLIIANAGGGIVDLAVVAFDTAYTSIVKRAATASDVADMITWVNALTLNAAPNADPAQGMDGAKDFFDVTDGGRTDRRIIFVWDGVPDKTSTSANYPTYAAAARTVLNAMTPPPDSYVINVEFSDTTWAAYIDNTPIDGIPVAPDAESLTGYIEQALLGSSSSYGAGYTLPPLAPPSGAPLQPLAAPTITSVTPVYPDSGGGVQGARLSIVVGDPGGNVTWKVQWKLSADTVWTDAGSSFTATGSPLALLTGLIPATGAVDVQVAYVAGAQVSPWSSTTTVTVAAALGSVSSTSKSASFTTTAANNVYYVDTSSAAITVTLNAAPAVNEPVEVWDATGHAGTNPISFAGNGKTIAGSASVASFININYGHARLIYDGTQWLMQ